MLTRLDRERQENSSSHIASRDSIKDEDTHTVPDGTELRIRKPYLRRLVPVVLGGCHSRIDFSEDGSESVVYGRNSCQPTHESFFEKNEQPLVPLSEDARLLGHGKRSFKEMAGHLPTSAVKRSPRKQQCHRKQHPEMDKQSGGEDLKHASSFGVRMNLRNRNRERSRGSKDRFVKDEYRFVAKIQEEVQQHQPQRHGDNLSAESDRAELPTVEFDVEEESDTSRKAFHVELSNLSRFDSDSDTEPQKALCMKSGIDDLIGIKIPQIDGADDSYLEGVTLEHDSGGYQTGEESHESSSYDATDSNRRSSSAITGTESSTSDEGERSGSCEGNKLHAIHAKEANIFGQKSALGGDSSSNAMLSQRNQGQDKVSRVVVDSDTVPMRERNTSSESETEVSREEDMDRGESGKLPDWIMSAFPSGAGFFRAEPLMQVEAAWRASGAMMAKAFKERRRQELKKAGRSRRRS